MKTLCFLALLFLTTALRAEKFFFRPDDWELGTEFPAKPELSETRTPKPEGDMVEMMATCVISQDEALAFTRILNPVAVTKARLAAAYDEAKNGMLHASGGRLISQETINILGHESRRYFCAFNSGALVSEQCMVIIGNDLFIFNYLHAKQADYSDAAMAFFSKIASGKTGG